jgi:hypothetical protein
MPKIRRSFTIRAIDKAFLTYIRKENNKKRHILNKNKELNDMLLQKNEEFFKLEQLHTDLLHDFELMKHDLDNNKKRKLYKPSSRKWTDYTVIWFWFFVCYIQLSMFNTNNIINNLTMHIINGTILFTFGCAVFVHLSFSALSSCS